MTERELDRTKGELVRALRRRAAELDAQEQAGAAADRMMLRPARRLPSARGRRSAFFPRDALVGAALTPTGVAPRG